MKVLVTGFDPFGKDIINPAWEAVKVLPKKIGIIDIVTAQIPTIFKESIDCLLELAKNEKPDVILCVGQAGGRSDLTIERIGINIDDARIPDNKNNQPIDMPIYKDGSNAYFVKLPIKSMMQKTRDAEIPCSISNTAGTFVCNHILYALLYHIEKSNIAKAGGFVHVPYFPSQVILKPGQASMSTETIINGLIAMISAIDLTEKDSAINAGTEH
ncbi:MAG: pyroglutamyl-peptidase I [Spirochaetota bacterium]|nr:pyroglutamyl-peptidase I [Spirochaetota bacterium]